MGVQTPFCAEAGADLRSGQVRKHEVEDDDVCLALLGPLVARVPVVAQRHRETTRPRPSARAREPHLVFDDQDLDHPQSWPNASGFGRHCAGQAGRADHRRCLILRDGERLLRRHQKLVGASARSRVP
jgi:hypothetical protein